MAVVDYDKFCHCVKCHKNMLIEEVIDGKLTLRLAPDYRETQYLLDDGSKMRVAICEYCKVNLTENDEPEIMKSVIKGWEREMDLLPHWLDEGKKNYLERYSKKEIVIRSENVGEDFLNKKLKEYKIKKEKKEKKDGNSH